MFVHFQPQDKMVKLRLLDSMTCAIPGAFCLYKAMNEVCTMGFTPSLFRETRAGARVAGPEIAVNASNCISGMPAITLPLRPHAPVARQPERRGGRMLLPARAGAR